MQCVPARSVCGLYQEREGTTEGANNVDRKSPMVNKLVLGKAIVRSIVRIREAP